MYLLVVYSLESFAEVAKELNRRILVNEQLFFINIVELLRSSPRLPDLNKKGSSEVLRFQYMPTLLLCLTQIHTHTVFTSSEPTYLFQLSKIVGCIHERRVEGVGRGCI